MGTFTINNGAVDFSAKPNSITGFVFNDSNFDGLSTGENGVQDVPINLVENGTNVVVASFITNVNGLYSFQNVSPGDYYIDVVSFPAFYSGFATKDVGADDTIDSDINPNGQSDVITMTSGLQFIIDIGLIPG